MFLALVVLLRFEFSRSQDKRMGEQGYRVLSKYHFSSEIIWTENRHITLSLVFERYKEIYVFQESSIYMSKMWTLFQNCTAHVADLQWSWCNSCLMKLFSNNPIPLPVVKLIPLIWYLEFWCFITTESFQACSFIEVSSNTIAQKRV